MPPRRRPPAPAPAPAAPARPSKLAREHHLTADQEAEIREAFSLFAVPLRSHERASADDDDDEAAEGVLRKDDVRRCLIALGIPPTTKRDLPTILDLLDPAGEGVVRFRTFFAYAALMLRRSAGAGAGSSVSPSEAEEEQDTDPTHPAHPTRRGTRAEVQQAYRLFLHQGNGEEGEGGKDAEGPITLEHLRRVARALKEDAVAADERLLRDMILEANGGAGREGVARGVGLREFEGVMRRAGVW